MKPNTKIPFAIPFHHNNPRLLMPVGSWGPDGGRQTLRLDPCGGFLHSLRLITAGNYSTVMLREANGAPIVSASPRGLKLITGDPNHIPIAINDEGEGALADMNASTPYTADINYPSEPGIIVAEYWPARAANDIHGTRQDTLPPRFGLAACINEWETRCERDEDGTYIGFKLPRVGNKISYLALIPEPIIIAKATLTWDLRAASFHRQEAEPMVFINTTNPDAMLPTTQMTRIWAERITPEVETARWVIRDVFGPSLHDTLPKGRA